MSDVTLLTSAYFPPAVYFSLVACSSEVMIEREENYQKQTYRNRCVILGANGPQSLIIPVERGSFHKTAIKELRIDNSRRWRHQHLRGIIAAYAAAPYFEYYIDVVSEVIMKPCSFLMEMNNEALMAICEAAGLTTNISYSDSFMAEGAAANDYRYAIVPKREAAVPRYREISYQQVFSDRYGFVPQLSILDILFNNGPGTSELLQRSLEKGNC